MGGQSALHLVRGVGAVRRSLGLFETLTRAQRRYTGCGAEADRRLAHEAGLDRHLVKPVDRSMLASALAGTR
jgi:hypothetical protein